MTKNSRKRANRHAHTKDQSESVSTDSHSERAGFFKRLLAMIYDTLVAVAVGMCAGLVMLVVLMLLFGNGVLSLQGYDTPSELIQ